MWVLWEEVSLHRSSDEREFGEDCISLGDLDILMETLIFTHHCIFHLLRVGLEAIVAK